MGDHPLPHTSFLGDGMLVSISDMCEDAKSRLFRRRIRIICDGVGGVPDVTYLSFNSEA